MSKVMKAVKKVIKKIFKTSVKNKHSHTWKKSNKYTSVEKGHKHLVVDGIATDSGTGHTHRILK